MLAGKKFANKVWNSARFVLSNLQPAIYNLQPADPKTAEDKKILDRFEVVKKETNEQVELFDFGHALHTFYNFYWHEFCDVYIEAGKGQMADESLRENTRLILAHILINSLKLLHPFMPFVTEEIWSHLPIKDKKLLMVEEWPS